MPRGLGRVFQRGQRWWIAYYKAGVEYRESAGASESEAAALLKHRIGQLVTHRFVPPKLDKVTVGELLTDRQTALCLEGAKALPALRSDMKRLRAAFGDLPVLALTTDRIRAWMDQAITAGAARATIAKLAGRLSGALHQALRDGRIAVAPHVPTLRVSNTRQGFFEPHEWATLQPHLPSPLDAAADLAYRLGWRKEEVLRLTWAQVDRLHGELRLPTSKTDEPRVIPLTGRTAALLEARWEARGLGAPWVFHRAGRPLSRTWADAAWRTACCEAGLWDPATKRPTKLFHDFRRTAYRNLIEAGVDHLVVMQITGHRSQRIAQRYNIRNLRTLKAALDRAEAPTESNVVAMKRERG